MLLPEALKMMVLAVEKGMQNKILGIEQSFSISTAYLLLPTTATATAASPTQLKL